MEDGKRIISGFGKVVITFTVTDNKIVYLETEYKIGERIEAK